MGKYLLKYNVDGRLYTYLERDNSGRIASMIKISEGKKLIRYDSSTKERHFVKHSDECMLAHRFQASESWVTVVSVGCDPMKQYDFPHKTSAFSFDRNGFASLFTTSTGFTSECSRVLGIDTTDTGRCKNRPSGTVIPLRLSNSGLFTDIIARNVREHINITESH